MPDPFPATAGLPADRGLTIVATYLENESGASLQRPELFRLLADSKPGDVLLIEQVDRLSRLNAADWERLRGEIRRVGLRVVALDLPTSWQLATEGSDDFTAHMSEAINGMLLDMLAAIARKDYEDRRRRQARGITKAKGEGKYAGCPEDTEHNAAIVAMLKAGQSWNTIVKATGCCLHADPVGEATSGGLTERQRKRPPQSRPSWRQSPMSVHAVAAQVRLRAPPLLRWALPCQP